ncbi:MAG: hypothetical protein OEY77_00185 [Nitrospira sp.]|nr:hypothetical protein [Nitrospira sp.]
MSFQVQGENGTILQVGGGMLRAAYVQPKPIEYVVGHYRTTMKTILSAAQVSNSRLFEIRNAGTNLLIPTHLEITVVPFGSVANPYLLEISAFKYTGFTGSSTVNIATPTGGPVRTEMAAYPGNASLRALTQAGAAAGMLTGTWGAKATNAFAYLMAWVASAAPTTRPYVKNLLSELGHGAYPMMFGQDEGFSIEHVPTGSATFNEVAIMIDISWCEAQAY